MKIALLQFAPEVGKVQENIRRADELLQKTSIPVDLDWLVLPEMAFSGKYTHSLLRLKLYFLRPSRKRARKEWSPALTSKRSRILRSLINN